MPDQRRGGRAGPRAVGIAAGVLLDAWLGDPARWHPVAGFGRWASFLEQRVYDRPGGATRPGGALFTAAAVVPVVAGSAVAERLTRRHPVLSAVVTAASVWTALGGTGLARAGERMAGRLEAGDLPGAREGLRHLCARTPAGLGPEELARASVESVAENTSDAAVAPLFWAAVAGVPGVLGYRAVNTLDAMVGYRSERYLHFGWASARLDDAVNLAPARLTGLVTACCAPVVGGSPRQTSAVLRRDARQHPSPNAGWCEASAAGALGVRLGGTNRYGARIEHRPELGAGGRVVQVADIRRAVRLERAVTAMAGVVAVAGVVVVALAGRVRKGARCAGR